MKTRLSVQGLVITAQLGLLVLVSAVSGTGCVAVIPTVSHGRVITKADVAFIKAGETTRAEIVQRFGADFRETWHSTAMAYSWGALKLVFYGSAPGSPHPVSDQIEIARGQHLFIAFDPRGIVTRHELVRPNKGCSVDDQLISWAKPPASAGQASIH